MITSHHSLAGYVEQPVLWPLRLAVVIGQLADLGTYLLAPRFEANPAAVAAGPLLWTALKLAFIAGVVAWSLSGIRHRMPISLSTVLIVVALLGAFGAGTNVAVLVGAGVIR